jgi:hypothetical protein
MSSRHLLIVAVVGLFVSATAADTIYVDDDNCPGPGSGTPEDPYCSIQTAIDNAVDTDEIVVAPGTYFETINFIGKAVWLRSADGPSVTTISADGPYGADTAVTCVSGEGSVTVLDGFTLTDGTGTFQNPVGCPSGGGMYIVNSSPTVTECTFISNGANWGGGLYNSGGSPTVTDCTFTGNIGNASGHPGCWGEGGGMYNEYGSPTLIDCAFIGNHAGVPNNPGAPGGGMYNYQSNPTVTNCTFDGNGGSMGGGMYNYQSNPTVTNCTFDGNGGSMGGGGMRNASSSPTVTTCIFSGNTANGLPPADGHGGGMDNHNSDAMLTNCTFSGSTAFGTGGGMRNVGSDPTVTNCTFIGNTASFGPGGGMYNNNSSLMVTNCILWGNVPNEISGSAVVAYSDVQGGWPGTGNIDSDPMCVDPANGDYRLSPGSPCIDAGNNNAIAGLSDTDLDGNPRCADDPATPDTGCGVPVVVDMGAYEYQGDPATVVFADLDGDGIVGMDDFDALMNCWSSSEKPCCIADLDVNGNVNVVDFLILLANWG